MAETKKDNESDSDVIIESEESDEKKKKSKTKQAKKAFESNDTQLSMEIHDAKGTEGFAKEKHKKGADFLKSIIYGGLDGIMTTFAVVTATAGATLGSQVVLVLGISNLIANAISMGVGDFISDKAESDHARAERLREKWEYDNFPKGEIDEMIELYEKKGMQVEHAKELVAALLKHEDIFIDTMMVEELGIVPPDPSDSPAKSGLVTATSFIVCGIIPLIPFIIGSAVHTQFEVLFGVSCALVGVVMFGLGAVTSIFTILPWWKGGLYMLVIGALGAIASYLIGWGIGEAVGSSSSPPPPVCNCTIH